MIYCMHGYNIDGKIIYNLVYHSSLLSIHEQVKYRRREIIGSSNGTTDPQVAQVITEQPS